MNIDQAISGDRICFVLHPASAASTPDAIQEQMLIAKITFYLCMLILHLTR
ncbi:MAG: hypothetical protein R3A45_01765 [Bdellovibrionota bacterium]